MCIRDAKIFSDLTATKHTSGDPSTQKNIFLGNKLPENLIFPKVECVSTKLLPPKRQEPNQKGGWTALTKSNLPTPQARRNLPTHPLTTKFISKNKYFCIFTCLIVGQSKTFTLVYFLLNIRIK